MNKAWLAYQRRVRDGYLIKIGKADDFDGTLQTLKFRIPASARRYDPNQKHWFVAEEYAHVLEDLFYDFRRERDTGASYASPARPPVESRTYQSSTNTPTPPKSGGKLGMWLTVVAIVVGGYWVMSYFLGSRDAAAIVGATPTRPAATASATPRSTITTTTLPSPTPIATQTPRPTLTATTTPGAITASNANVRSGPCLNHAIIRTLPQGTPLSIVGYSRDATHVWYALRDGGWVREDVVRNAPTVPEVSGPECPSPPTPTPTPPTRGCPGGCLTYPTFCAPPIKGNISIPSGEKIYHMPHQQYYESTTIDPRNGERWFCTEDEARTAGWRKAYR